MFGYGMPELIIILIIALIVFGPQKLPELARSLGKGLAEFRRAVNEFKHSIEEEARLHEHKETPEVDAYTNGNSGTAEGGPADTVKNGTVTPDNEA